MKWEKQTGNTRRLSQVECPRANFRLGGGGEVDGSLVHINILWGSKILGSPKGVAERFKYSGCDNELLCERLPTMENFKAFRMSRTTHPLQQNHIPDDKNLHVVRLWECLHSMSASHPITINLYKQPATSILHNQLSVPHISPYIKNANLQSNTEINFSLWARAAVL